LDLQAQRVLLVQLDPPDRKELLDLQVHKAFRVSKVSKAFKVSKVQQDHKVSKVFKALPDLQVQLVQLAQLVCKDQLVRQAHKASKV
jgi:hypothetical protein